MARSYLFIPGNVPRMLQNMDVFDADAVIIDFEDAVSLTDKDEARHLTQLFLRDHLPPSLDIYVRINSDAQLMKDDLIALETLDIQGIVLPKCDQDTLKEYEASQANFRVIGIIETPQGMIEVEKTAMHPCIDGLILGAEDLKKEMGFTRSSQTLYYPRQRLLYAAKAANIKAIDTPFTHLDESGLSEDACEAAALGYESKCAIHPNQVPTINQLFLPSEADLMAALKIVKKHEQTNSMRFSLDGKMIDKPVIDAAKQLIEKSKRYGVKGVL